MHKYWVLCNNEVYVCVFEMHNYSIYFAQIKMFYISPFLFFLDCVLLSLPPHLKAIKK